MQCIYALARVSSKEQNEARQIKDFLALGIPRENIFIEKASGKSFNRSTYNQLLKHLSSGDILYIASIDRLGRDYDGIIREWTKFIEMNVAIKVLDMPLLDTDRKRVSLMDRFLRNIILHILAFQAEQEWQNIKKRQKEGIATAKEQGKQFGRPKASYSKKDAKAVNDWQDGVLTLAEAMIKTNRKKSAFYELVNKLKYH